MSLGENKAQLDCYTNYSCLKLLDVIQVETVGASDLGLLWLTKVFTYQPSLPP